MFNLGTIIKTEAAITLLRKGIENQLKEPVKTFVIMYKNGAKSLNFEIPLNSNFPNRKETKFWYENDKLITIINVQITQKLKKGQELNFITLEVNKDEYNLKAFYTENNEKKYVKLIL